MKLTTIALVAAAGLSLAACGSKEEAPAPETNATESTGMDDVPMNAMPEVPTAAPTENVADVPPPPSADLTPEAQTQDDADASGMTARVSRDEGNESAGQPAQ